MASLSYYFIHLIQKYIALTGNVNLKLSVQLHYVSELTLIPEDQEYHSSTDQSEDMEDSD